MNRSCSLFVRSLLAVAFAACISLTGVGCSQNCACCAEHKCCCANEKTGEKCSMDGKCAKDCNAPCCKKA